MRYMTILYLLLAWLICAQPAAAIDWPADLSQAPEANKTDIHAIESLLNEALGPASLLLRVGEFRFVPLETASRIDLIASAAISGRGALNAFVAVWRTPTGYGYAILPADVQGALGRDVVDLDGSGLYEVVAGYFATGYQGKDTMPIPWYGVYALKQGKFTNVSDRYPEAIPEQSLNLVFHLTEACEAGDKARIDLYRINDAFVQDKYQRMLFHHQDWGLDAALGWANSPVPGIQLLAIETLSEIPDPRSLAALRRLAEGPDAGVRIVAKGALAKLGAATDKR